MSISCWYCDVQSLSDPALFSRCMSLLPWEERRKQVMRFRFEKDRRLCLGAGLLLAYALRHVGASNLSLRRLPNGKPALDACPDIHFNLSHSGTLAVCAVSDQPVGVDVEVLQSAAPGVEAKCFQPREREWIHRSDDPDRAFTRLWTRKESYLKLLGTGILCSLDSFCVLPEKDIQNHIVFSETERINCLICVCTLQKDTVVFKRWRIQPHN